MESGWPGCFPECSSTGARGIRDGLSNPPAGVWGHQESEDLGSLGVCFWHPPRQMFLAIPQVGGKLWL